MTHPPLDQVPEGGGAGPRASVAAWVYGLLGLIPFVAGAVVTWAVSGDAVFAGQTELLGYGALILSFLGGARWGLEIGRPRVRALVISASMLPSIVGFLLLLAAAPSTVRWRLGVLAGAFMASWLWDVTSRDPPAWYRPLRHVLTAGAVICLLAGAAASATR